MKAIALTLMLIVSVSSAQANDRGDLILNCHTGLFEGELHVYKNKSNYTVSYSGVEDYPTQKISAGPGGIFLKFFEAGDGKILSVAPYTGEVETTAEVALEWDPDTVIHEFTCRWVM